MYSNLAPLLRMPSSSDPKSSLTVYDAVSTHRTLQIMFWVVILFLPMIFVIAFRPRGLFGRQSA